MRVWSHIWDGIPELKRYRWSGQLQNLGDSIFDGLKFGRICPLDPRFQTVFPDCPDLVDDGYCVLALARHRNRDWRMGLRG